MVVLGTTYYTDCTYRHHLAAITMVCVISRGGSRNCEGGGACHHAKQCALLGGFRGMLPRKMLH